MSPRAQILHWAGRGHLPSKNINAALELAQVFPNQDRWRKFLSLLMLATGTLLFGSGVIFFFAYNWNGLPPLVRFAIVEALLVASFTVAWIREIETLSGRAALFFAALMTGALFALIGQTYQLGADPWQLFALWAVLILPWAFAARQPDLWLLSLLLANVALGLRPWLTFQSTEIICVVNVAAHLIWEFVAPQPRLGPRLVGPRLVGPRLVGIAAAVPLTILIVGQIFHPHSLPIAGYLLWLTTTLVVFSKYRPDLLLVSAALLSAIIAITCLCARGLIRSTDLIGSSLLIALIVIALSTAAAKWLQSLQKS